MIPGKASFELIGSVGKITVPRTDKDAIFISVAVQNKYKDKVYTNWHNNIVMYGEKSKNFMKLAVPGTLIYLTGTIGSMKAKGVKYKSTLFIATEFLVLRWTEAQKEEINQRQAVKEIEEEDMYNSPDEDEFPNEDVPY